MQQDYRVLNFTNLDDPGQPYSCSAWGSAGPFDDNLITNDPGASLINDFHSNSVNRNIQVQVTANQAYVYHSNPDSTITVWNEIGTGLYAHNGWYRTDF